MLNSIVDLRLSFCMFVHLSVHIFVDPSVTLHFTDMFCGNFYQTSFRGTGDRNVLWFWKIGTIDVHSMLQVWKPLNELGCSFGVWFLHSACSFF